MRKTVGPTHQYQDDSRGPRIQKVLAEAGVGSRRACEEMLAQGRVTVDGHLIDGLPAWVNPHTDDIRVDGRRIKQPDVHVYVMLFKPKGVVASNSDPEGRPCAVDLVKHPAKARLYPVGRLDMDSSGLLLLTNDGALANRLTHPRFEMAKGYEVMVGGGIEEKELPELERRIFPGRRDASEDPKALRSRLVILNRDTTRTLLYMELRDNRNRDLRKTLATFGHPLKKLRRVRMGPLQLKSLQVGEWRELTARELGALRDEAFATPQQRAARQERAVAQGGATAKKLRGSTRMQRRTEDGRGSRAGRGGAGGRTGAGGRAAAGGRAGGRTNTRGGSEARTPTTGGRHQSGGRIASAARAAKSERGAPGAARPTRGDSAAPRPTRGGSSAPRPTRGGGSGGRPPQKRQ